MTHRNNKYLYLYDIILNSRISMYSLGGRIMGKSACEHFCLSGNSCSNDIAQVLNPHDMTRSSGGSSSGSAALVSSRELVPF